MTVGWFQRHRGAKAKPPLDEFVLKVREKIKESETHH